MYHYTPYKVNEINTTVSKILLSQEVAEYVITQWLATMYKPQSFLNSRAYVPGKVYIEDRKLKFTSLGGKLLTNPGNVSFWTGVMSPSARIRKNPTLFKSLGCQLVEDNNSMRVEVARQLGMFSYAEISSKLNLFSPCAVAFILLTAKTYEGQEFRKFVRLGLPSMAMFSKKLVVTYEALKEAHSANV